MAPGSVAPLLVAAPLAISTVLAGLGSWLNRRAMDAIAFTTAAGELAGFWWLASRTTAGAADHWAAGWVPGSGALGIRLMIEPLGAGFAGLAAALAAATFVFSWRYFEEIGHLFHALMLVLLGGIAGLCLAGDLFNLFVFLEVASVAGYALTAYKVEAPALVGALNFALTNTLGGVFVLIGIALIYARTGMLDMALAGRALGTPDALAATALALLLAGFLVKAAIAPFHFWLPDAYAVAPTPVTVLFGGVMLEIGIFATSRVYWLVFAPALGTLPALRTLLVAGGAITAVVASVMSLLQRDLKRLLAFTALSHVAVLVIGAGLLTANALAGVAIGVLSHGPLMGALFLCAGIVRHGHHSVDELWLFGRGRDLPWTAAVLLFAAVALTAPPFSGLHAGTALVEDEARALGYGWLPWLFVFTAACPSAAVLRAGGRVFLGWGAPDGIERSGPEAEDGSADEDTSGPATPEPWLMLLPAAALAIAGAMIPLLPSVRRGALLAAAHLVGVAPADPPPLHLSASSIGGLLGSVALAVLLLSRHRAPRAAAIGGRIASPFVRILQSAHTPHAGDHIGWLVLGTAIIALVLNLALT